MLINLPFDKDMRLWLKTPGYLVLLLNGKTKFVLFNDFIILFSPLTSVYTVQ